MRKALFLSVAMFIAYQTTAQTQQPKVLMSIQDVQDRAAREMFLKLQSEGTIVYEGEDKGKAMFSMFFQEGTIVHVYEEEILNFIKTGTFIYDEQLNKQSK